MRAFGVEILLEQFAQPAGLDPDDGVGGGIEIRILAEYVDGDRETLETVGVAFLLAFHQIAQKLAGALGAAECFAGKNSLQRLAHCGGSRRGMLQVSDLSSRHE